MLIGGRYFWCSVYVRSTSVSGLSTSLPYIWHVACLAGKFIYPTSIVVWYFFWVLGFDALLYCVCASESDVYVCMFKEIGKFSDFWAVVCKCCPFFCFLLLFFLFDICAFFVFVFSLAMCVFGKLLFCAMICLFPNLPAVFLLLVGVTEFCWYDSGRLQFCVRSGG